MHQAQPASVNSLSNQGCVIWLTGLPASGKSTIAASLTERMRSFGLPVETLDGDEIRRGLSRDLRFSIDDRKEHNRRIIFLSKVLLRNGIIVLVSLISPYRQVREFARRELSRFIEVHVKCTLEQCIIRDPKGYYAKALRGEITNFTGIDDPYEEPQEPDVTVDTEVLNPMECANRILDRAIAQGYLRKHRGRYILGETA